MRPDDRASITFLHRAFTAADDVGGTDSAQWRKAMGRSAMDRACHELRPCNEGRLVGAKRALKQQQVWAIRFWLDQHRRLRARALSDLAVDSKLRGCDLVSGGRARDRAIIAQQKTKRPVQLELMDTARNTIRAWLERCGGTLNDFAFPIRNDYMAYMSTRQYARLVREWVIGIGCPRRIMGRTRFGERRPQLSTRRPSISAPFKFSSVMQRLIAPFAIWAPMWRTLWSWPNGRNSNQISCSHSYSLFLT